MRAAVPLLAILAAGCATANRHAELARDDVLAVASAPSKWNARDWKKVGAVAGIVGGALLLDDEIAGLVRSNDAETREAIADAVEPLGGGTSDKIIAAFLGYGLIWDNDRAKATAFDSIMSSVIASKVITPALKATIHRTRPSGSNDESFPSNHATQAFAVATVVASHYEHRPWIGRLAYSLATGVAAARVYHDDHYTSDVLAGAAIGAFVGRTVVKTNNRGRAKWTIMPTRHGVVFTVSF